MTPFEIVIDTCKRGGFPLSEEQAMLVGGSVAFLVEKERQDEREACAQLCDALHDKYKHDNEKYGTQEDAYYAGGTDVASECSEAIRARGGA